MGLFLRKPGLLLLQLPVLAESELWSLLTQVVGGRDLPSPPSLIPARPRVTLCSLHSLLGVRLGTPPWL